MKTGIRVSEEMEQIGVERITNYFKNVMKARKKESDTENDIIETDRLEIDVQRQ